MRTNRKFPYLSAYLQKLDDEAGRALVASVPVSAWAMAALVFPVWLLLGSLFPGGLAFVGILVGILTAGLAGMTVTAIARKKRLANDPREQRRRLVFKTGHELRDLEIHRKLHRWMDPVALHLLEAGAYHWSRIQAALNGPQWGARELPTYWQHLKRQVSEASTEGMADLLLLTRSCIGPPQKDRESDIKGIFESFVDLDLADAMQGLKQMAKTDWTAYAHQSPQSEAVAIHGRTIAERLKELADDVDAKASEIAIDSATTGGLQSLDALDSALGELRTVRQAESELEQRISQL